MLGQYIVLTRTQLWVSIIAALLLAIPGVSLLCVMVMFPIIFFAAIAIIASFWLIPIGIGYAVLGPSPWVRRMMQAWQMCTIMWIGASAGISRWDNAGAAIGAKGGPFLSILFMPWQAVVSYLIA